MPRTWEHHACRRAGLALPRQQLAHALPADLRLLLYHHDALRTFVRAAKMEHAAGSCAACVRAWARF